MAAIENVKVLPIGAEKAIERPGVLLAELPLKPRVDEDGKTTERVRKQYIVFLGFNETVYDMSGEAKGGAVYLQQDSDVVAAPVAPAFVDSDEQDTQAAKPSTKSK